MRGQLNFFYFISAEYLEANFYSCAAYGVPIDSSLTGGGPTPTGCTKANLSPQALAYATAITEVRMRIIHTCVHLVHLV